MDMHRILIMQPPPHTMLIAFKVQKLADLGWFEHEFSPAIRHDASQCVNIVYGKLRQHAGY